MSKSIVAKYVEYLKDNPIGYWFRRRVFGWGWIPATREGWIVLLIYMVALLIIAFRIDETYTDAQAVAHIIIPTFFITAILLLICWKTGEPPKWQWGFGDKKNA